MDRNAKLDTLRINRAVLKGIVADLETHLGVEMAYGMTLPIARAIDEADRLTKELTRKGPQSELPGYPLAEEA
jgi:hypothetical protein